MDCIFCKIVKGDVPCYKVYEDDKFFAFLDIFPRSKGHVQVIPKQHYRWSYDMSEDLFKEAWGVVYKITVAINKSLKPSFVTYMTFGRQVAHAHLWVIPRYDEQTATLEMFPGVQKMQNEEFEQIAKLIREQL